MMFEKSTPRLSKLGAVVVEDYLEKVFAPRVRPKLDIIQASPFCRVLLHKILLLLIASHT